MMRRKGAPNARSSANSFDRASVAEYRVCDAIIAPTHKPNSATKPTARPALVITSQYQRDFSEKSYAEYAAMPDSLWRLRTASGTIFGVRQRASINVTLLESRPV